MERFTQSRVNSSYAVVRNGVADPRASDGGWTGRPRGAMVTSRSLTGKINVGSLSCGSCVVLGGAHVCKKREVFALGLY